VFIIVIGNNEENEGQNTKMQKKKCFPSVMVHRRKFISMNHTYLLGDKGKKKKENDYNP
jgi:hypothetical protein